MKFITKMTPVAAAVATVLATAPAQAVNYELWASDQSNSVAGESSTGTNGSFLQVFDGTAVEDYIAGTGPAATPLPCNGGATPGPCDLHALFPETLVESDSSGLTGATLGSVTGNAPGAGASVGTAFGRLHGALPDPQHKYVNMNMFGSGQGYIGILKADTKEAVALFRVTGTNAGRSNHMSFWGSDGEALYIANLHGRILERIDIDRDPNGNITAARFNQAASMGVGANTIVDGAKAYTGTNGAGNLMLGSVVGAYTAEATALLTPNGECRQNGCGLGPDGGRPGNVIVCPIVSSNDKVYITFGGGGLLVADGASDTDGTMQIVGEYSNDVINGAGCGGVEAGGNVYLNAGASASGAGATQSEFTMYRLTTNFPDAGSAYPKNFPRPRTIYKDVNNTATGGATDGPASNSTGQLPVAFGGDPESTRRDAHGAIATVSGHYVHNVDRIQNTSTSFDVATGASLEYSLENGACAAVADSAVPAAVADDPAPDLMDRSPNGDFLFFAARGPVPATVKHAAQGACPGVGVISLTNGGKSGVLGGVVRTYNSTDTASAAGTSGAYAYTGTERSDPHGVAVVIK